MRFLIFALALFLSLALVAPAPALAQSGECTPTDGNEWCITNRATLTELDGYEELGFQCTLSYHINGQSYTCTGHVSGYASVGIKFVMQPEFNKFVVSKSAGQWTSVSRCVYVQSKVGAGANTTIKSVCHSNVNQIAQSVTWKRGTDTAIPDGAVVTLMGDYWANTSGGTASVTIQIEGTGGEGAPETQYSLPLREIEDAPSPVHRASYYEPNTSDVLERRPFYHYSEIPGALVFPAAAGTITSIRQLGIWDAGPCHQYDLPNTNNCNVYRDNAVAGIFSNFMTAFINNPPALFSVTLETEEHIITYVLKNANEYVYEGAEVGPDCAIGQTTEYYLNEIGSGIDIGWPPVGLGIDQNRSELGVVFVNVQDSGGVNVDILDQFTLRPTGNRPCNQPPGYEACFGDATLSRPSLWTTQGSVTWNTTGGTVRLGPGAVMLSNPPLLIDEDQNPGVRATARTTGGNGTLRIRLGTGQGTYTIGPNWQDAQLISGGYEPDLGSLYTLSLRNMGDTEIEIRDACVQYTTGPGGEGEPENPAPVPPACYFANNSFNNSTGSWNVSSAIDGGEGQIYSASGGEIWQNVALYPNGGATDYTVTVRAALWYYNTYTPNPEDTDEGVTIEYRWPSSADWAEIGATASYGAFAQNGNVITFSETFSVSDTTSGEWRFRFSLTNVPAGVRGIAIREVCINAGAGYNPGEIWPPPPEGWGPPPPPFNASCSIAEAPAGGDGLGAWIDWLWRRLNNFFQCDLMVLLNRMHETIMTLWRAVGFGIRYAVAVLFQNWQWVESSFFPWAEGHLANMSNSGPLTYTEQCDNLWCFLTNLLGMFRSILDLLNTILGPVLGFVFDILRSIIDFVLRLINSLLLIVGNLAVNVDAPPPDGIVIPGCNPEAPDENGFCIVNYILAHTVLNPYKAPYNLIIPLLISFGSIKFLLWAAREIKKTLNTIGQSI